MACLDLLLHIRVLPPKGIVQGFHGYAVRQERRVAHAFAAA